MAVTLPSDLIADVMRNADPARKSAAAARLKSVSAGSELAAFDGMLGALRPVDGFDASPASIPGVASSLFRSPEAPAPEVTRRAAYQNFERMVLRNLFESLLPPAESGAFGSDVSSGVWRSMAADQFAGVYAKAGGIGIAKTLAAGGGNLAPAPQAEWPYFRSGAVEGFQG